MIWKLSLTGIKSRLKDYLVLFSGLIVASMIFYMFLTIAINPSFISHDVNASTDYLNFTFAFGIVLLVLITFVYLINANSLLLSMRKHDYGMFMSLGAKSSRIGLLIFIETLITGILATIAGIVLGFGLTAIVSQLLITKLNLQITHFAVIYPPAIGWTLIFFIFMFFWGAIHNVRKLTHTPIISLLKEDQKPAKLGNHPIKLAVEAVLGLLLLAAGYHILGLPLNMFLLIIPGALITIVAGTYFIFDAACVGVINFLIRKRSLSYRGLRVFILGQLKFRLHDLTKILTIISLLFALALGAITVGLNFTTLKDLGKESIYYDNIVVSASPAVKTEVAKLHISTEQTYHYKENRKNLFLMRDELKKQPVKDKEAYLAGHEPTYKTVNLALSDLAKSDTHANNAFSSLLGTTKKIKLVSHSDWQNLPGKPHFLSLMLVKNFEQDYPTLLKIQQLQLKENPHYLNQFNESKPVFYQLISNFSGGFEFMGFFLGLAFLTMLASTLMFKVLSGAARDRIRYQMLYQIGARRRVLSSAVKSELGTLFLLPAVLGILDVLFGLKLFRILLPNPYHHLWIPFTIFIVLYFIYYAITVKLYQKVVLPQEK